MPGHMIKAKCTCGFTKEMMPGYNEFVPFADAETSMAYSESGADLDTFKRPEIERRKLTVLPDPFLDDVADWTVEKFEEAEKRKSEPQGPYHCPKCQLRSLYLYFGGDWD
jgi:hypothetical protein